MTDENIDHIVNLYLDRKDVEKEAHLASYEEIKENDYNLNIPRYVDTTEEEPEIDLREVYEDIKKTNADIKESEKELVQMMKELSTGDEKTQGILADFTKLFEEAL